MFGERKARSQPGGFDPEQIDQPRHAVVRRPGNNEIRRRLARAADLGPYAGIAWRQRAIGEIGPIAADRGVKLVAAGRIDRIIERIDPFDIRAETRGAPDIELQVNAEPARLG